MDARATIPLFFLVLIAVVNGKENEKISDIRLPGHLIPKKYDVNLVPFLIPGNFSINGSVSITVDCIEDGSKNVTLHSVKTEIKNVRVEEVGKGDNIHVKHHFDEDRDFLIIDLTSELIKDRSYVIHIEFVSSLDHEIVGFFKSTYKNGAGEEILIASTQFQATHARKAFPCFDEPALKATFEVSLGRLKNMTTLSNMPLKMGQEGLPMEGSAEYVWDHYEDSVPMSSYLVAFAVTDFGHVVGDSTGNNVTMQLWARKNALDQIDYAQDVGPKLLKFYEEFFDVPYPLPKQDMIAIPQGRGAMENWGLITYPEYSMSYKEGVSSKKIQQSVAKIVSHEIAHQWFGDLVTPEWWTDLWLNEGFATYISFIGVEAIQPSMKLLEQFVLTMQNALELDALESSHQISIVVNHPDEISEIFDEITYNKGGAIIQMMDYFLTRDTFRKGLTAYFKDLEYDTATQDDLWRHLTVQGHTDGTLPKSLDVKTVMDTWTLQTGYPVVNVKRNYGNANRSADLTQTRFFSVAGKEDLKSKWWVPITFATPSEDFSQTNVKVWMNPYEDVVSVDGLPEDDQAVIFNVKETGYYRVNYDSQNWELIRKQLLQNHTQIDNINRAQIINDAFNLAKAGLLDYEIVFGITSYLSKERSYIVWKTARAGFKYVETMLKRTEAFGVFRKYVSNLVKPVYQEIGRKPASDSDENLTIFLRSLVVAWSCDLGLKECTEESLAEVEKWMESADPAHKGANPVNKELRTSGYCTAVAEGDESHFNFVLEHSFETNVQTEKSALLRALTCTKEIWLLNRLLNMTLSSPQSGIPKNDLTSILSGIAGNVNGRDLAADFVTINWEALKLKVKRRRTLLYVFKDRNTEFELNELRKFQTEHLDDIADGKRTLDQTIERTSNNVKWMEENYSEIREWLETKNAGPDGPETSTT